LLRLQQFHDCGEIGRFLGFGSHFCGYLESKRWNSGGFIVLRTIEVGSCVSVQGVLVRQLDNGRIVIKVGDRTYEGLPISSQATPALS